MRLQGNCDLTKMVDERICSYHDGRVITEKCEPYPVIDRVNIETIEAFLKDGTWTESDLQQYGLVQVDEPIAPEGKRFVADAEMSYIEKDGRISVIIDVEDIPPPPPEPTFDEKIQMTFGMSRQELRQLLLKE